MLQSSTVCKLSEAFAAPVLHAAVAIRLDINPACPYLAVPRLCRSSLPFWRRAALRSPSVTIIRKIFGAEGHPAAASVVALRL